MDKADAALKFAEQALITANKALRAVAEVMVIKGERGEPGPKGETGPKGDPGIVSGEAMADVYKGTWKPGAYTRGSTVTFGGSQFLALEDTSEKPESGRGWQLTVKRGRDGRDGKDGAPGLRGPQGPIGTYKGVA